MPRPDGRRPDELRPLTITPDWLKDPEGSALIRAGETWVICTASVEEKVPPFLKDTGRGWVTAEYAMLPRATNTRGGRQPGGRGKEIERLIGRALRASIDLTKLGPRTITIDCDVLEADGGTRTAAINGAFVALVDALTSRRERFAASVREVIRGSVAAVSVGLVFPPALEGAAFPEPLELLDLDYLEDRDADVDLNLVMTGAGQLVEVQAGGEEATFSLEQLARLLELGKRGIDALTRGQREALGADWPLD